MMTEYKLGDYVRIHDHDGAEITVQITDSGAPNQFSDFMHKAGARMFKNSEILGLGDIPVVSEKRAFAVGERVRTIDRAIGTIDHISGHSVPYRVDFGDGRMGWYGELELHAEPTPTLDAEVHAEVEAENERARILSTAEKLINGDRAKAYGHPKENFGRIAALWNAQLGKKLSEPLTAEDVAYALVQLKMSRLANTPGHEDSLVDVAGYIALAGELK